MRIAKEANDKLELNGSGREVREFLDLEDLCESLLRLIKIKSPKYSIYNLGSGNILTIKKFIEAMAFKYEFSNEIIFLNPNKKDDLIGLDSKRFQEEFNINFKKLFA
jgi:nucleoside-diphosphate-sugar epimerase